jgi:hypothetical protein
MVVVFDDDGRLDLSAQPYDKRVAGVISGAGSFRPGVVLDRRPSSRTRVPVALAGRSIAKWMRPLGPSNLATCSPPRPRRGLP